LRRLALLLLVAAGLAGCGGTATLDKDDANALKASRAELDNALDTTESIRTSKAEARRLVREVRRLKRNLSQDNLRKLEELVPSLVAGHPAKLDESATRAFLGYATSVPAKALRGPVKHEVDEIDNALGDADPDTKIPTLDDQSAEAYLKEAAGDVRALWPDLAKRLDGVREDLG
jgi:hypothetical protein